MEKENNNAPVAREEKEMLHHHISTQDARIAFLETHLDILETDRAYMDTLLVRCGFENGMLTLRQSVEERIREIEEDPNSCDNFFNPTSSEESSS